MSAIRERTILCVIDLPKSLTSRRNLAAHFSKFGNIKAVSVKKEHKTAMIHFSTHFEAQAAKNQGGLYLGEQLNIFWSDSTALDPRAKVRQQNDYQMEQLWEDDSDKEVFGVEAVHPITREDRKQSAKDLISQHLKLPKASNAKKRISLTTTSGDVKKADTKALQKSPIKIAKVLTKSLASVKKNQLIQINKRRLNRKGKEKESINMDGNVQNNPEQLAKCNLPLSYEKANLQTKLDRLNERDKSLREGMVKDSNIKTAVVLKGTCPDMCPERERILRQCRQNVAVYEMFPGTNEMDENKAVKEYSRSSADQEVPLPHDLRPEPVLSMTMIYLITNIISRIDHPDENKSLWYSFCWNRLRSIRKDIILQQLCDMETVMIVEQCARFHICCYDHMCGADVGGFDDKINTQNLIDCLQTLKHMYEDLEKLGITCPNEPEFYSYLILLKLTTGDVMWEYQQYSSAVQLSPQVQFAIEAYMVFKNNMYSRYFRLVKKASYLTACLMQRYFNEVRIQALKSMLKTYCLPGKNINLSSSFVVSTLKFDSQKNAVEFSKRIDVDLKIDLDDSLDGPYVSTTSFLVREKRVPITNAVIGVNNALPVSILHDVHSSFDENSSMNDSQVVDSMDSEIDSLEGSYNEIKKSPILVSPNISKMDAKETAFKFSLSPIVASENVFSQSIFSINKLDSPFSSPVSTKSELCLEANTQTSSSRFILGDSNRDNVLVKNSNTSNTVVQHFLGNVTNDFEMDVEGTTSSPNQTAHTIFSTTSPFQTAVGNSSENVNLIFNQVPTSQKNIFHHSFSPFTSAMKEDNKINSQLIFPTSQHRDLSDKSLPEKNIEGATHLVEPDENKFSAFKFKVLKHDILSAQKLPLDRFEQEVTFDGQFYQRKPISVHKDSVELVEQPHEAIKEDDGESGRVETAVNITLIEQMNKQRADEEERLRMEKEKQVKIQEAKKRAEDQRIIQNLRKIRNRLNAFKTIRKWKDKIRKIKAKRADFPMLVQLSVTNHLLEWGTVNSSPVKSMSARMKKKNNSNKVVAELLNCGVADSCRYVGSDLAETLARCAARNMKKGFVRPVCWKMAISMPWATTSSMELSVFNRLMKRWCSQSFYKGGSNLGTVQCVMTSLEIPVNISIHFTDDVQSSLDLDRLNALIFVIVNESETEKLCLQRLQALTTNQSRSEDFSVVILNVGGCKLERVMRVELEELHDQNFVSHWAMKAWTNLDSLIESLNFLTEYVSIAPHICTSLLDLLIKQVSEDFFDALSSGQHLCEGLKSALHNPNSVIQLYNMCLTKLEDVLVNGKLEKYFSISEEFKRHISPSDIGGPELVCGQHYDEAYKTEVANKIHLAKLSEISNWPVKSSNHLLKMLKHYCCKVRDANILPKILRILDLPDDSDVIEHVQQVSWLNIVEIWALCNIKFVFSPSKKNKSTFVLFNKNDVVDIIKNQWWLKMPIVQSPSC